MNRTDIINEIIRSRHYTSYLEIGFRGDRQNFEAVRCAEKLRVDPEPGQSSENLICQTSDEFFDKTTRRFDLVFIDGDHSETEVFRDVVNAIAVLSPGGSVIVHDALPPANVYTQPERRGRGAWTGDVWKVILDYAHTGDYDCYVVDCDWGVAVIDSRAPRQRDLLPLPSSLEYSQHFRLLKSLCVSPGEFLEKRLPDYAGTFEKGTTIIPADPAVGIVVGSYRAPAYVHLHLECRKRFYPMVPLLVHDDCSDEGERVAELCAEYGAEFRSTQTRQGHPEGDLAAFIAGMEFGNERNLDLMVKFSRRWVSLSNFLPELRHLAYTSQYPTFSNSCASCEHRGTHARYPFRTECMAWHVASWGGALSELKEALDRRHQAWGTIMEFFMHRVAIDVWKKTACQANNDYTATEIGRPSHLQGYGVWAWMESDCRHKNTNWLWHRADGALDYQRLSQAFGLPYQISDFKDLLF